MRHAINLILALVGLVLVLPFVNGVECGSTPIDGCQVTQNTTFINGFYHLPTGIKIGASSLSLDCNGSILNGTNPVGSTSMGIESQGGHHSVIIKNCTIQGYDDGIGLRGTMFGSPNKFLITNNIFRGNIIGIEFFSGSGSRYNNITENLFQNNTFGISLGGSTPLVTFNNIWNNNFINNSNAPADSGSNNAWNISSGGNYFTNYDNSSEGCANNNSDLFCDSPYNLSGSAGNKDYLPFQNQNGWKFIQITNINAVQVVPNVDLVQGKTTLVRVSLLFLGNGSNATISPSISLYWNGTLVGTNTSSTISPNQSANIDFWYVPQINGSDIEVRAEVTGNAGGLTVSTKRGINVNIIQTRDLNLYFTQINDARLDLTADRNSQFLSNIYPIRDGGVIVVKDHNPINTSVSNPSNADLRDIRYRFLSRLFLSKQRFTAGIGIVKEGYLSNIGATGVNFAGLGKADIILVDESQLKTTSHELGHTYQLCDEYNSSVWSSQNAKLPNGCPNGDLNHVNSLSLECSLNNGCSTATLPILYKAYGEVNETTILRNIMGGTDTPDFSTTPPSNFESWISSDSFNALLARFRTNANYNTPFISFLNHPGSYIIVRIFYEKNGSFSIAPSYVLENGYVHNASSLSGNFSIRLYDGSNNMISNISFEPNFIASSENGSDLNFNESFQIFALPSNINLSRIVFSNRTTVLQSINKTQNAPIISIQTPQGNHTYSNEIFNISWNGSDADGNQLNYTVLLVKDDGTEMTIDFDLSSTSLLVNSSAISECDQCKIHIVATDGMNTNSSFSAPFSVDNDLQINNLSVAYTNNTQRVFRFIIKNSFSNSGITNLSWSLDTGQSVINSTLNMSLSPLEDIFIYVYSNYTSGGNYSVKASAFNSLRLQQRIINITV